MVDQNDPVIFGRGASDGTVRLKVFFRESGMRLQAVKMWGLADLKVFILTVDIGISVRKKRESYF